MYTPKEYILDQNRPPYFFVSGLELFKYLLTRDIEGSIYKCKKQGYDDKTYGLFKDAMENHEFDNSFNEIQKEVLSRPKHVYKEISADTGSLDIEALLANDTNKFIDNTKKRVYKHALTLVLDCAFNWHERFNNEMLEHHKQVYSVAFKAFSEKRPCRVIAVNCVQISEMKDIMRYYIILKDFSEPLHPGIWGVFSNNEYSNAFSNVLEDLITGTHDRGNGNRVSYNITKDIPEGSEVLVLPRNNPKITYTKGGK